MGDVCDWCGEEPATETYAQNPRVNTWELMNKLTEYAAKRPKNERKTTALEAHAIGDKQPQKIGNEVELDAELTLRQVRDVLDEVNTTDSGSFSVCKYCDEAIND